MTPAWTISADGEDVTARLADYLVSMTLTDQDGIESDSLSIEVADPLAQIALPRLGAKLSVSMGYASPGPVAMGDFVVDGVELSSPPRRISIRAHSADLREGIKERKDKDWEGKTLGEIVQAIAGEQGLTAAVGEDLKDKTVERADQTNESDISFLTRLGQQYDAIVSVKAGRLILAKRGQGAAVSGQPMDEVELVPGDVTSWSLSLSEAEEYTAAEARYYDRETAQEEWVRSGAADGASTYRLRGTYSSRDAAQSAADAKRGSLDRGTTSCSITLPGRTDLAAETPLNLAGFDPELDGRWIVTQATHRLDGGGYTVSVSAEREAAE